jgi:hypothetical protein
LFVVEKGMGKTSSGGFRRENPSARQYGRLSRDFERRNAAVELLHQCDSRSRVTRGGAASVWVMAVAANVSVDAFQHPLAGCPHLLAFKRCVTQLDVRLSDHPFEIQELISTPAQWISRKALLPVPVGGLGANEPMVVVRSVEVSRLLTQKVEEICPPDRLVDRYELGGAFRATSGRGTQLADLDASTVFPTVLANLIPVPDDNRYSLNTNISCILSPVDASGTPVYRLFSVSRPKKHPSAQ